MVATEKSEALQTINCSVRPLVDFTSKHVEHVSDELLLQKSTMNIEHQ